VSRYILDTNVMIALLTGRHLRLEERIRAEEADAVAISSIVAFELYYGAFNSERQSENLVALDRLRFSILPFEASDAFYAGELRASLRAKGTPIGPFDVLIAGQALARNLTLVTSNVREFRRVPRLAVEDWLDAD
jgi:tRNA(fMet)-specific endonuclease VapC